MKKLVILLLIIGILAGLGVMYYGKTLMGQSAISDVLPEGALLYVQLDDVEKNLVALSQMPIWQGIQSINYDLLLEQGIINGRQAIMFTLLKKQLLDVANNPLAKKLFGQEVAIAAYPLDKSIDSFVQEMNQFDIRIIEDLLSGFYLVTRVAPDVQLAEFVSRFFGQLGSNVTQEQVDYSGETIHVITVNDIGMKFGLVRLNDLMVIGVGDQVARSSIDVFKYNKKSLAQDTRYQQIRKKLLNPAHISGFFNLNIFVDILRNHGKQLILSRATGKTQANMQEQWNKFMAQMSGLDVFSFSTQVSPALKANTQLFFDREQLNAEFADLYTCPAEKNQTINFVPQDVIAYQWNNCFLLDHYWRQIKNDFKQSGDSENKIEEYESQLGFNIERDIIPVFGEEIGGYMQDLHVDGFFPRPLMVLFVEIKDQAKAQQLLARLQEQPMAMIQEEQYGGVAIKYLALPLGQGIQPAYAFWDRYFLLSTSRQLIKDSIDSAQNTGGSLASSALFKDVNIGLTDANRSVQFVQIGRLVDKIKSVMGWANQWSEARNKKTEAFKAGGEKPLEEVRATIARNEKAIEEKSALITSLDDEIWEMESKSLDVTAKKEELGRLKEEIENLRIENTTDREREIELAAILKDYEQETGNSGQRQLYFDEIIFPVLDGLKHVKSYGLRSTIVDDAIETSIKFKLGL